MSILIFQALDILVEISIFLASTVFAHVDMRYDAESALPKCPYLIIVEVKKGTTVSAITSKAQLLAELLTLQYLDR